MLPYCPPNITLSDIWINHGISHCFMDTVAPSVMAGFIFLFGTIQIMMYRKYGTRITDEGQIAKSKLYNFQIFLLFFFPVLAVLRLVFQIWAYSEESVYGYMILSCVLTCLMYPFSVCLVMKERFYLLPSVPTRGHGLVLLLFWTMTFIVENLTFINMRHEFHFETLKDKLEMSLFGTRYICDLLIFTIGLKAPGLATPRHDDDDEELLRPDQEVHRSAFYNMWKKLKQLFPYLWPKRSFLLQFRVILCILLLVAGRVVKLFLPIYRKKIVDSLTDKPIEFRWDLVLIFVAFSFLQGGGTGSMGLMNNLRSYLWIPIQQYTTREIEVSLFRHLHHLSLRWHLQRKTGEVLRVMDRGTDSINNLLNYIIFSIAPAILDILVAVVFFITVFNWWFGLIVFLTMALYMAATILITEFRTKYQRRMNLADNEQKARSVDSLLNFETVKYYGAENYEVDAYGVAIQKYQKEEFLTLFTLNILNTAQNFVLCGGLLAGSLVCVYLAVHSVLTVGDYVLFITYLMDLYMPLNWFGTYYRAIQKNFVDMENMFDLLKEEEEIIDAPGAGPLRLSGGSVEFSNVSFGYTPERFVLKNINFKVDAGKTVALVGASGAGKSTIVRLLFRFYDVTSGSILIDGQNVKLVQQNSLRKAIGVVPQDTVLFNQTIFYNIEYGKIGARTDEVYDAAKSADIHERILSFPDKYETKVGERGLRLSGGEKQRVAIARTILKSPAIVLLDEATSALDTQTERNIQSALARVCSNRTTIIIAHRLSTIIHADEILVLKEGAIVERGCHDDLLVKNGLYADMWNQQLKNLDAEKIRNGSDGYSSNSSDTNGNGKGGPKSAAPAPVSAPHGLHH